MSFCYSYIKPLSQEMAINFWVTDNKRTPQYPVAQLTLLSRFLIAPSTFIKYYLQIKAHTYHLYLFFSAFFQPFFFRIITPVEQRWLRTPEALILKRHLNIPYLNLSRDCRDSQTLLLHTFSAHLPWTNNEFFIFLFNHSSPHYRKNFCYQLISSTKADISIFPLSPVKF